MNNEQWIQSPALAREWAMGRVEEAKQGSHRPVEDIHMAAFAMKTRFYANGQWAPGAEPVYNMLREIADLAQDEYEDAQPPME